MRKAKIDFEYKTFQFGGELTEEQKEYFEKYGVIHFKRFIEPETALTFIAELEKIEQKWLAEGVDKINGIPLKFGKNEKGEPMIQRMCFTNKYSAVLNEFLHDPRFKLILQFLAPYEGRVGEDEKDGLVFNHYINQPNSKFSQMGWHTDSPRDLFLGQKILPMLNVGIHLDDCPSSNGGLRVLPGTQNQSVLKLLFGKKQFIDHKPDAREVAFEIERGDLTIHDGRLWHRVEVSPNFGEKSRRRVMYVPVITGKYKPKSSNSKTPFYHRFSKVIVK
ncbi:phytanoyl-CoA dioxygenase [Sandaracinomonas limnophila]|uniref:Phytanoyl-CoA dioxygenase n=1 Tax=Sandaracinomonas limnophila TaxID=1862386 RepID=A0A437PM14_9BACT|nr:phytanoyl-CoA dioxygenase family protein [Sandaracinomonas limnophila]RVU23328.1 phytanoyl-CoA dioxygenase [Sandaracinomonas limnophila]